MITSVKEKIKGSKIEWKIRTSVFYEIYLNIFYRAYVRNRKKEMNFYRSALKFNKKNLFFDIGANGGDKADIFLRMGAKVVCIEPDKSCCNILEKRFKNKSKNIVISNKAVSDSIGNKTFYVHEKGSPYNTFSEKWTKEVRAMDKAVGALSVREINIETTTIDSLITSHGNPHFIKIDIEGHEIHALKGLSSKVPFITFELNLPAFSEEGIECIDKLASIDPTASFNFFVSCENGLQLSENVDAGEFKLILKNTNLKYMEILCQMDCSRK
jgi:FkbM family methyltransferase